MNNELLRITLQVKAWTGSKGVKNWKSKNKQLRKELYDLFPKEEGWQVAGDFILEKQYNPVYDKEFIAIYSKESWNRREEFLRIK